MTEEITIKKWIADRVPKVKGSSLKTYKSYERAHILPYFGSTALAEIDEQMLHSFKQHLAKSLAAKTTRDILIYLRTLLREAEDKGLIQAPQIPKVSQKPKEKEILTYSEQKALSARLKPSLAPLDMAGLLSLATGLRLGEVAGLRYKDIDLEARVMVIRKNRQRVYDPRTAAIRLKT